jgi:hypothetical protein
VDFVPIPTVDPHPPALAGLHFFGIVQYIGNGRTEDWTEFYGELFGFQALPDEQRFGILPKGRILRSPCGSFYLQLIEPEPGHAGGLRRHRMLAARGLGTPTCWPPWPRCAPRRGLRRVGPRAPKTAARSPDPPGRRDVRAGPPRSRLRGHDAPCKATSTTSAWTPSRWPAAGGQAAAMREAGFGQVMLSARDLVGHPDGLEAAVQAVQASGLRVTGFQVLRDFEGLSGHLHDYKVDIAKSMLEMCAALGSPDPAGLLVSTSVHATQDLDAIADLRKLAMLAIAAGHQGGL